MQAYIDKLIVKTVFKKQHVTHKTFTDEGVAVFRQEAIEQLKKDLKDNDTLFTELSSLHMCRLKRLKTELKIIKKYFEIPSALHSVLRKTLITYAKEEAIYSEINNLRERLDNLIDPQTDSLETFADWIGKLTEDELTIMTDLISDL